MNVIIDGLTYQPVEQKVDKEREDAIRAMRADINATNYSYGWDAIAIIYDAGYRLVGEEASKADLYKRVIVPIGSFTNGDVAVILNSLLKHFDITKKVGK